MNAENGYSTEVNAVRVARELVRQHGYEKFRLTDVARELGMSHAALYKYFTDKDALLDAVNAEWLSEIDETLEAILYAPKRPSVKIEMWFTTLYHLKREKILADIEPYQAFIAADTAERPFIIAHLETQQRQLELLMSQAYPDKNSSELAKLFLEATLSYHHPQLLLQQSTADRTRSLHRTLRVLLRGA